MKREFDKKPIPPGALFADSRFSLFYRKLAADADALGFDDFGVVPAGEAATFPLFDRAVKAGQTAGLDYLEADVETRRHPRSVLPSVAAMIIVVISQKRLRDVSTAKRAEILDAFGRPDAAAPRGAIVDYALGVDYHEVARAALKRVQAEHRKFFPDDVSRAAADTAPILEKDWATRADLGICGLNSLTIHPRFGSRFFLGELLVSTPFQTLTGFASPEELAAARAELAPRRKITADFCLT
ncbi:MAG: DUF1730 domain-containing protein, partial [Thermoguttaceae bacterium]|nr:DUF1730 domain-containing protein [Thermoguttaceae bacterium]